MAGKTVKWESQYWKDPNKLWDELPVAVQNAAAKEMLSKAAEPIASKMKELSPVADEQTHHSHDEKYGHRPGFLRDSIGWKAFRHASKKAIRAIVGFHPNAFYGWFLEFGTSKMEKKPFMRPAWDETKDQAMGIVEVEMGKALDAAAKNKVK